MSLCIDIVGIIPADDEYREALATWHSLKRLKIRPPVELLKKLGLEYETGCDPNPEGAEVGIRHDGDVLCGTGAIITLADLPPEVKKIRVYSSC